MPPSGPRTREAQQSHRRPRRLWWTPRRRRVALAIALVLVGVPGALYLRALWLLNTTDRYARIGSTAWDANDPARLAVAVRSADAAGAPGMDDSTPQTALDSLIAKQRAHADLPPPSPRVRDAADAWVNAVNQMAPPGERSILFHSVDALGNLYIVLSAEWAHLPLDDQTKVVDRLGTTWRAYLHEVVGEWDTRHGFAPGIVVVDAQSDGQGPVAQNINGKVTIFRAPSY